MSKLLKKYKKYIFSKITILPKNSIIIMYGSSAYGKRSSDLDVVFILQKYNKQLYDLIEKYTIQFQIDNKMKIDEEVPYFNKLVYTFDELENILDYSLFKKGDIYTINPILVNEDYFASKEMRYRLMLNILTTYSKTINGEEKKLDYYKRLAWKNLIVIVSSYNNLDIINIKEFIELLYFDRKNNVYGEDFLGYKKSNPELNKYIQKNLKKMLNNLSNEGDLIKLNSNEYKIINK